MRPLERLRNIAIIAHVDHGKTTLIDKVLQQTGALTRHERGDRLMDSNDLERERGITILAKNTAVEWGDYRINIVDTPGHADFGGEVERILSMVDSVLLLVDAVEGPMPQTRFVTAKSFEQGLRPIVVVNKIDRPGARCDWVVDKVFELFYHLDATEEQLDFPVVYTSAIEGVAGTGTDTLAADLSPLLELIVEAVPSPTVDRDGPFQMQVSALDYSSYVGVIGLGRVNRGSVAPGDAVVVADDTGGARKGRILQVMDFLGLERVETGRALAGDIVSITGVPDLRISETLCDPECVVPMPALAVDEPTISMSFVVNASPFAGQAGQFVTSRNLRERLERELQYNVALRVAPTDSADVFKVSGRGELHLAVLIETMRREGYELAVSKPEVILREVGGRLEEPFELVVVDCEQRHQGQVMEELGSRNGRIQDMVPDARGRVRLEFLVPTRGLIGFRTDFLTMTSGSGLMSTVFSHYQPMVDGEMGERRNGVLISMVGGKSTAFALFNLQARGKLFIGPGEDVYEGMIVGLHSRPNDLVVNPVKGKQLTNIRAAGSDENVILTPRTTHSLEQAIEFINDDELVEVTPDAIRLRKKKLKEHERKRSGRNQVTGRS